MHGLSFLLPSTIPRGSSIMKSTEPYIICQDLPLPKRHRIKPILGRKPMGSLTVNSWGKSLSWGSCVFIGGKFIGLYDAHKVLAARLCSGVAISPRAFAGRNSEKKLRRDGQARKRGADKSTFSEDNYAQIDSKVEPSDNLAAEELVTFPSRGTVLQACTVTSGLIAAFGIIIRQVSHVASVEGLPVFDCSLEVSFNFELWHVELITGSVILISLSRYLLLKTWPDFAESSDAANQQVLTSLQPLDYIIVALFPGVSEELLFRGALLPLFGSNWRSALVVAIIFGVLHLGMGSGRKYSFAVWATFVGLVYGYATIVSSSLIVPMASHAVNNLVAGILWRYADTDTIHHGGRRR